MNGGGVFGRGGGLGAGRHLCGDGYLRAGVCV